MSKSKNSTQDYYPEKDVIDFFYMLKQYNITYLLIKNINNELPNNLQYNKDIDILVHPKDYNRYKYVMLSNDYKNLKHPYGIENGWMFLYALEVPTIFQNIKNGLLIDACSTLCTKSLNMNAWIPLDKEIQESIWKDKILNKNQLWYEMDKANLAVYLVTRAIFEKNFFSDMYKMEIKKIKSLYYEDYVVNKFEKIFFKFTPKLIYLLKNEEYDDILKEYISFAEY